MNQTAAEIAARYTSTIQSSEKYASHSYFAEMLIKKFVTEALDDGNPSDIVLPPAPQNFSFTERLLKKVAAEALDSGNPSDIVLPPSSSQAAKQVREAVFIAQDAAMRRLWQRHRIVYDIDPQLWEELGESDPGTLIPRDLLTRLPHADPFIAFPVPLLIPIDKEHRQRVEGFFVTGDTFYTGPDLPGIDRPRVQCSTSAPGVTGNLTLTFGGTVETYQGRTVKAGLVGDDVDDMVFTRCTLRVATLPASGEPTLGALIESIAAEFSVAPEAGGWDDKVPTMLRHAVSALFYICAVNADLRPLPAVAARRQASRDAKAKKPARVIQVGFNVGAALRAYRRTPEGAERGAGTGRSVRPHVRRSHFHTYRVGAGRRETIVKWLAPIPINVGGKNDGKSTVVTIK